MHLTETYLLVFSACSEPPASNYTTANSTGSDSAPGTLVEYSCLEGYQSSGGDDHLICEAGHGDEESVWIGAPLQCQLNQKKRESKLFFPRLANLPG